MRRVWLIAGGLLLVGALVATLFLWVSSPPVAACGPFFVHPVFVTTWRPDPPLERFAAGHLGHVRPTWARRYLVVAYRYLQGHGLDADERKSALGRPGGKNAHAVQSWLAARHRVTSEPAPAIETARPVANEYWSYENCPENAFETATATLADRSSRFGPRSQEMTDWLAAQDLVFSNCSGGRKVPGPLPSTTQRLARQDRAYQIAAAQFYAGEYDRAEEAFREIATDASSPWAGIAPYLAARCLVRKGTVGAPEGQFDRALLERASRELHRFAQATDNPRERRMAEQIIGFVDLRIAPLERVRALGAALERGNLGADIDGLLYDYTLLLDRAHGEEVFDELEQRYARARRDFTRLSEWRATSDLTDWILTFQASGPEAAAHAVQRWRQTGSPAWLVATLDKASTDGQDTPSLLETARAVTPDSPAFATAFYHIVRLLLGRGQQNQAREAIDRLLAAPPDWSRSSMNELLAMRMALARNLDEFVRFAPRQAAAEGDDFGNESAISSAERSPRGGDRRASSRWTAAFDEDAAAVLNRRLPLSVLERVAATPSLSEPLRAEVGLAAWTRAVLLGEHDSARRLSGYVERAVPSLSSDVRTYRDATSTAARDWAATFLLLKLPGLRPMIAPGLGREPHILTEPTPEPLRARSDYRDNWWCEAAAFSGLSTYSQQQEQPRHPPAWPAFLDDQARASARAEDQRLQRLRTGPIVLCDRAVAWAKQAPSDPRVPEALALAVRASRYGCWTPGTTASSRAAFQLLKTRYANTTWARQTKYYY